MTPVPDSLSHPIPYNIQWKCKSSNHNFYSIKFHIVLWDQTSWPILAIFCSILAVTETSLAVQSATDLGLQVATCSTCSTCFRSPSSYVLNWSRADTASRKLVVVETFHCRIRIHQVITDADNGFHKILTTHINSDTSAN